MNVELKAVGADYVSESGEETLFAFLHGYVLGIQAKRKYNPFSIPKHRDAFDQGYHDGIFAHCERK